MLSPIKIVSCRFVNCRDKEGGIHLDFSLTETHRGKIWRHLLVHYDELIDVICSLVDVTLNTIILAIETLFLDVSIPSESSIAFPCSTWVNRLVAINTTIIVSCLAL